MTGVESVPLVDVVPRACRAVPGDCSGYRVPLPGSKLPSAAGFPGRCLGRCLGAGCLRCVPFRRVLRGLSADVPKKAEIEAVGTFGRRSLVPACLDSLRPCPSAFLGFRCVVADGLIVAAPDDRLVSSRRSLPGVTPCG